MKTLKTLLLGLIIGALLGFWTGYNKGRGAGLFSNPFKERSVTEKLKSSVGEGMEKAGKNIEKMGKDIKNKLEK
jgi:gas vesicle protein